MKSLYSALIAAAAIAVLIVFAQIGWADDDDDRPPSLHSWSEQITKRRFNVLSQFGGEAVLDKETGLVWEQSPTTATFPWTGSPTVLDALSHCYQLEVGGRKGWRVPSIEELASLVDALQGSPTTPALPAGHPFNVQPTTHWSSTTNASDATRAWAVGFSTGTVFNPVKTGLREVWCVRGGQGIDGV